MALLGFPVLILVLGGCSPGAARSAPGGDGPGAVETLATPAAAGALAPELSRVAGRPALSWLERAGDGPGDWRLRFSRLGPDGFEEPVTIAPLPSDAPGEAPQFFANWADRPGVVQGGSGPDGPLYAWWLAKLGEGPYAYGVELARSADGGVSWEPLGLLHDDRSATEHGFVTLIPEDEGVRAFWLDGRATARGDPMTLRTARVTDRVGHETAEVVDPSVCDCCNTVAVRAAGAPLVLYRDRSGDEVRDVWAARKTPGGWTEPRAVHRDGWEIAACPVNGPAVARHGAGSDETVWAAWFTGAPAEEGGRGSHPRVLAAVSRDGGRSFGEPVMIDEDGSLGRLDLAVDASRGEAIVSWLDTTAGGEAAIRLRRVSADGRRGPVFEVARAEGSRASGVPRLLADPGDGGRLLVAWVEPAEGSRAGAVRLASLPLHEVPSP